MNKKEVGVTSEFEGEKTALRRQEDFEDLQRESAGVNDSRISRFLGNTDNRGEAAQRKARKRTEEFISKLDKWLQDPAYRKAYEDFGLMLLRYEQAADRTIDRLETSLDEATHSHVELLQNANRLPDGRRVFRRADGIVFNENHEEVSAKDAACIVWKDGAPTYEEFTESQRRIRSIEKDLEETHHLRHDVLAPARDRHEDPNDPMTMDDFEKIEEDIEKALPQHMTDAVKPDQSSDQTISAVLVPDLGN